jgi:hypothetical protein
MDGQSTAEVPKWRTWREGIALIVAGITFRTCIKVSLVVGTLLSVVNQGQIILEGEATAATWVRVVINFVIPYVVASVGYIAPFRSRPDEISGCSIS